EGHQAQPAAVFRDRIKGPRGRDLWGPLVTNRDAYPRLTPLDDDLELAVRARRRMQQGIGGQLRHAQDCLVTDRAVFQRSPDETPGLCHLLVAAGKHPPSCPHKAPPTAPAGRRPASLIPQRDAYPGGGISSVPGPPTVNLAGREEDPMRRRTFVGL